MIITFEGMTIAASERIDPSSRRGIGVRLKTIGLIGGMSWESTVCYYRQINEAIKSRLGGLHSAKIVLHSVDFQEIVSLQHAGDWEGFGALLAGAGRSLEIAGADVLSLGDPRIQLLEHVARDLAGRLGAVEDDDVAATTVAGW